MFRALILLLKSISYIRHELVFIIPGPFGNFLRHRFIQINQMSKGEIFIDVGCVFSGTESIRFADKVSIGRNGFFAAEGGSIQVGEGSAFNTGVHINASVCGRIVMGKYCLIGPNVVMRTANHRFEDVNIYIRDQGHKCGDILIEDDCWIGANAVILGGVTIGVGSIVAAGAVVTQSIPPRTLVGGVPARKIKMRGE